MEMLFKVQLLICEVVNQGSFLDVVILVLNSHELHLLFGVFQVLSLAFLHSVSPHSDQLVSFIPGVDVVEDSELRTKEVSEMLDFYVSYVEGDEEFVVIDQTTQPFVVRPTSHS